MWVAPSPLKKSVLEQWLLQISLHSYWARERLGMGKTKDWMYSATKALAPKLLHLQDAPFKVNLGLRGINKLKSQSRCWRRLKGYFVSSLPTWIKQTVLQACKRGEDLTSSHRWGKTPLPSGHSCHLLLVPKDQTQESTLSIMVCLE